MSDPHVVALRYRFQSLREHERFENAQPLSGSIGPFDFTLDRQELVARPRDHFADRQTARDELEGYLRAWEERALLSDTLSGIRFDYQSSEIIDRDPTPGVVVAYADVATGIGFADHATAVVSRGQYPNSELNYVQTPETAMLAERVRRVRDREAELPATAYYVLTVLQHAFGSGSGSDLRASTADALGVDRAVLGKLGGLASKPDPKIGRKSGIADPLSDAEIAWLRAAIIRLARRPGEVAGGAPLPVLRVADLPPL